MRKGQGVKASKVVAYIVIFLVLVAVCGLLAYFTGGFTSDFKTFYVKVDGKDVLSTAEGYELTEEKPMSVDVKYTFSAVNKDISGYSVKVVPNAVEGKDFDFTLDGQVYSFQAEPDLTAGFDILKDETSFTIKPKGGIMRILSEIYPDGEIEDCSDKSYKNMYALVVTSYNGKASVTVCFSVTEGITGIMLDQTEILF